MSAGVATFPLPDGSFMTSAIRRRPVVEMDMGLRGFPGDWSTEGRPHDAGRAVHIFHSENYRAVESRLGVALPRPAFGENITTSGFDEADLHVGDLLRVGQALLRVTQPTERCAAVGRSLGLPQMLKALHAAEACGCYASVVKPGRVASGDTIEILERPCPEWSIRDLHRAMFSRTREAGSDILAVIAIGELAEDWKHDFLRRRRIPANATQVRSGVPV